VHIYIYIYIHIYIYRYVNLLYYKQINNKLMHILKRTGIDWRERRLISKLYMDQRVKVRMD